MKKDKVYHIAIDGPAGAGKSTVARKVAEKLGIAYLDTGAMYRVVAYKALSLNISLEDEEAVTLLANKLDISFRQEGSAVYCDGEDVTAEIRSAEVSKAVSLVASYPGVRERLVALQQKEALKGSLVMDGRDIGTHVLPAAEVKIFLTASVRERAQRRYLENIQAGKTTTLAEVMAALEERDRYDSARKYAPLKPAEDAVTFDTTGLTIEEVVEGIVRIVREKLK